MGELVIRSAGEADLPAIDAIYNHYVAASTCTWQYEPTSPAERRVWLAAHDNEHPVTVATLDGAVVGWASLSSYRQREGYRFTVENAVYVHHERQRLGIGGALLSDLLDRARGVGHRTVIAGVSADQPGSLALHRAHGFTEVARIREVGFKFGLWLDLVFLQKML